MVQQTLGLEIPIFATIDCEIAPRKDDEPTLLVAAVYTGHFELFRLEKNTRLKIMIWLFDYIDG